MSKPILPSRTIILDSALKRAAVFAAGLTALIFTFFVLRWTLGNAASTRADHPELARITTQLAPDDPQTHFAAGVLNEKQFDLNSLELAIDEYEKAAALSPNNYLYWLALGSARDRSGDAEGGEHALRKAVELAPYYSRVHWALGNALVRQGRSDEGFAEIRNAVVGDPTLADLAASTAWNVLRGDVAEVQRALGESGRLNASLALLLTNEKRFDEALAVWASLPVDQKRTFISETAATFAQKFYQAGRFRDSARILSEIDPGSVEIGQITNGGFEDPIRNQNVRIFEWSIAAGQQPQIAPTSGQTHGGGVSLVLVFNSMESRDYRSVSQTVAVEPGREYEMAAFYRADLKTKAAFQWDVLEAMSGSVLASTEPTHPAADWTRLSARFRVPPDADGVIVRLRRINCDGPVCQIAGNLWFDDMSVRQVD